MTTVELVGPRELFVDARGDAMRATWHPELGQVTLSMWRGDECRATFPMTTDDLARLGIFATAVLADAARSTP
jgi:hypothetical protein